MKKIRYYFAKLTFLLLSTSMVVGFTIFLIQLPDFIKTGKYLEFPSYIYLIVLPLLFIVVNTLTRVSEPDSEIEQPIITPISNKRYSLTKNHVYLWDRKGFEYKITVPSEFSFDGTSIPRPFWTIVGMRPADLTIAAATIHDWIYEHLGNLPLGSCQYRPLPPCIKFLIDIGKRPSKSEIVKAATVCNHGPRVWNDVTQGWSQESADKIFARILRETGISPFKRRLAYAAVHFVGFFIWSYKLLRKKYEKS